MKTFLDTILENVREEVAAAKRRRPVADLRSRVADAPPVRDFAAAVGSGFGLIAEIKERSPSVGPMRTENIADAPGAYADSPVVRAVSVLTNEFHFGMSPERLPGLRERVGKPVLRKDFLIDEYQIREARAFGADAVLLMANVLDAARLKGFHELALELGMEALFEVHVREEIDALPTAARVVGINSRKFRTTTGFVAPGGASEKDFSLDYGAFDLVGELPAGAVKVAESGLSPSNLDSVRERFDGVLVGTSLLRDPRGLPACLAEFERAILG